MATLVDNRFAPLPTYDIAVSAHDASAPFRNDDSDKAGQGLDEAQLDPLTVTADGGSDDSGTTDMLSLPESLSNDETSSPYPVQRISASLQPVGQLPQLLDLHDPFYGDKHKVALFGNWVVPGALMVGTNPMFRSWNLTIAPEQRLRQLIRHEGITLFYSLQKDMEKLWVENLNDSSHEASYHPMALQIASQLSPPVSLQFRRFSIADMGIPGRDGLMPVLAELEQLLRGGQTIYMHCRGGVGRAGTVAACLLVHMYGIDAEEALTRIQRAYKTRGNGTFGLGLSPETAGQTAFVRQFEADLKSGQLRKSAAAAA